MLGGCKSVAPSYELQLSCDWSSDAAPAYLRDVSTALVFGCLLGLQEICGLVDSEYECANVYTGLVCSLQLCLFACSCLAKMKAMQS